MSFPAPDDGRPPPAPQHAVAWDVRTPLQLHVHRAVRLLAAVGGYGAGLCLIIGMVALVAVDARPGRQTHITAAAEQHFRRAIDWARRQGALSWELRAATSLARLRLEQDRGHEAKALLQPVYNRFTEGFGTADLKAVKTVLDSLPAGPAEN